MLKYLFEVHFKDGSIYQQTQEDKAQNSPTGSAFTDIKERLDDIDYFALYEPDVKTVIGTSAVVSMLDGHFEINGVPFISFDPSNQLAPGTKYTLIYFRRVRRTFNADDEEINCETEFHIGWQATVDGKNYQQTIALL